MKSTSTHIDLLLEKGLHVFALFYMYVPHSGSRGLSISSHATWHDQRVSPEKTKPKPCVRVKVFCTSRSPAAISVWGRNIGCCKYSTALGGKYCLRHYNLYRGFRMEQQHARKHSCIKMCEARYSLLRSALVMLRVLQNTLTTMSNSSQISLSA